MSQNKHIWFLPMNSHHNVLLTLMLSDKMDKQIFFSAKILRIYIVYIMQKSDWHLNHPCQCLLPIIYLCLFSFFQPSCKVLLFWFTSVWCQIFPPLGKHSWQTALGGRLLSSAASVPFQEHPCVTERHQSTCHWWGKDGAPPQRVAQGWPWACAVMWFCSLLLFTSASEFTGNKADHRVMWCRIFGLWELWSSSCQVPKVHLDPSYSIFISRGFSNTSFPLEMLLFHLYEENFMRNCWRCFN